MIISLEARAQSDTAFASMNNPLHLKISSHVLEAAPGIWVLPFGEFRRAQISYGIEKGNFRHPQEAETVRSVNFQTEGIRNFKKWLLYGRFSFERRFSDSLAWDLSFNKPQGYPYYFATPKAGDRDEEMYSLKGIAARRLSDRFHVGLAAAYKAGNAARTVDPRPSGALHEMCFEPIIRSGFGKFGIALSGFYTYGSVSSGVIYMNEAANDKPSASNYLTYEVLGYGNMRKSDRHYRTFEQKQNTMGAVLQGDIRIGSDYVWGRVKYAHGNDTLLRNISNYSNNDNLLGRYKTDELTVLAGYQGKLTEKIKADMLLQVRQLTGKDALFVTLGGLTNYVYQRSEALFLGSLNSVSKSHFLDGTGFTVHYVNESKKDGITQHRFSAKTLEANVSVYKVFARGKSGEIIVGVEPGIKLGDAVLLVPPAGETLFTGVIARPEEAFYKVHALILGLKAGWGFYVSGKRFVSLIAFSDIRKAEPNNARFGARRQFGLNLNFSF